MTAVAWLQYVLDWSGPEALVCLSGGLLLMLGGLRESLHRHGPAGMSAWLILMVSCLIVHVFLGWCPLCLASLHGVLVCLAVRLLLILGGLHESCIAVIWLVLMRGWYAGILPHCPRLPWLVSMVSCLIVLPVCAGSMTVGLSPHYSASSITICVENAAVW